MILTFLHHRQPPFQGSGSKKTPRAPARSPRKTAYSSRRNSSRMNTASCSWTEFPHKRNRVERGVLLCGLGMKHDGIKEIIGARLADSESKSSRSHRMENSRSEMSGARVPTFLFPPKLRKIRVPHPHLYIRAWQRFIMRPQWTRKPTQSKSCARI